MFSKPINLDTEPFPYSVMGGLLGNFSWHRLLDLPSKKIYSLALVQVLADAGVVALLIFGLMFVLLFDGSLVDNGIIAWFFAVVTCVAIFIVGKRLLRQLVAMWRLLKRVRHQEKVQEQKLKDLKLHL